jgi:bifunctional non-homologous end joining protein LigD
VASKSPAKSRSEPKPGSARAAGGSSRLATYRRKRDFSVTPEPQGTRSRPAADGNRFVVQRHRASSLHYDFRLEVGGVLASWAVPKGPTLDPKPKRLAMHVEDHPLEYFDFEGVIPQGEYGGGDVIVWDWGTWTPADGEDPLGAIAKGSLHFDLDGQKLAGRFALVRKGAAGDREHWLLIHKNDEHAAPGWDAEDHPQSVKSGRTNDEVAAAPAATWSSEALWHGATAEELQMLGELGKQGQWSVGGKQLKLTNLDKVLFPKQRGHRPLTKRDLIGYYARTAPAILPYLAGRPINLHRYPDGIGTKGFWHKARPDHAPDWIGSFAHPDPGPGETETYSVFDSAAALAWAANFGAIELHPWTSTAEHPYQPTWAMVDLDPGERTSYDDLLTLARLHRTALGHLGVEGCPKVSGQRGIQIWIPVADGYTFDGTRDWVEKLSRIIGEMVPELVSWEWTKAKRRGKARLDFTQNAINKTLVAPFSVRPAPGAPVSVPIRWDELDDPELRSDRWTIDDVADRLERDGDPLAPLIGKQQRLPAL